MNLKKERKEGRKEERKKINKSINKQIKLQQCQLLIVGMNASFGHSCDLNKL